jgi:4-alpha-glucanotransferase
VALAAEGLLAGDRGTPGPADFTVAMYGYLSLTPSVLTGVSLADAVGDRRTQNIPGTSTEYPNWQVPLCDATGTAVLLEDLGESALLRDTVAAARGGAVR